MRDRILLKWAIAGAVTYTLAALAMIGVPLLWGDTTARCKPAGFQAGAVFRAADADCLDTSPRNTFNSQISDTNIRAGAAIQGNKIDGVFASLISTSNVVFASPGIEVARLRSSAGIVLDASALASTGILTFAAPAVGISALYSASAVTVSAPSGLILATLASTGSLTFAAPAIGVGALYSASAVTVAAPGGLILQSLASVGGLLSLGGAGVVMPMAVLQSRYTGTAPPPASASFANTMVLGYATGADFSASPPTTLASFNLSFDLSGPTPFVSVFFATPPSTTGYAVLTKGGNDPNCVALVSTAFKGVRAFTLNLQKPSDASSCRPTASWDVLVVGGQ